MKINDDDDDDDDDEDDDDDDDDDDEVYVSGRIYVINNKIYNGKAKKRKKNIHSYFKVIW